MRRIFIVLLCLAGGLGAASAQIVSGRVIATPYFDSGHKLMLSQTDYIYGTARSAAMGGAFASLGADLSSMSINPAGLGMYQSSDWGVTAALSMDKMNTSAPNMRAGALDQGGSRTSFGLNNLGIAYNVYNSSKGLTSLTIGFAYNRTANFNSRTSVETFGEDASITQMFQNQMNMLADQGFSPDYLNTEDPFYDGRINLDSWGAILGYQNGLVGVNDQGWYNHFDGATPSDSYFGTVTRGGIEEYNFSIGANVSNILYLGASLGLAEINYKEESSYEEYYGVASISSARPEFSDMWFDQTTRITGSGFAAKIGAVVRPIPALRIGAAFHLPTYYSLTKSYIGKMGSLMTGDNDYFALDPVEPLMDNINFSSAPRLLTGVSAVVAEKAILAVDYEVAWYDRFDKEHFKPAQTIRAGFETTGDLGSLRLGGSYMFDMMKDDTFVANVPTVRSAWSVTAGLGLNIGQNGYLDLAYVFNRSKYTNYDFFYYEDQFAIASQYDIVGGVDVAREYTPHRNHHMISLTLGARF